MTGLIITSGFLWEGSVICLGETRQKVNSLVNLSLQFFFLLVIICPWRKQFVLQKQIYWVCLLVCISFLFTIIMACSLVNWTNKPWRNTHSRFFFSEIFFQKVNVYFVNAFQFNLLNMRF